MALQLQADTLVVRAEDRPHVLRVELLGLRREADEVAEEHGDDLALLVRNGRLRGERSATHPAQSETIRVFLAAARTDDHAQRLRRVHGIAQMRDTGTGDDCRIPQDGRCVREVVEQPHSCA